MAPVQVPQETPQRAGFPAAGAPPPPALGLIRVYVQLLQVFVALFILHGFWVFSLPQPLLLVQLLLQPLLPAQLVQWQPLEVSIVLHVPLTESSGTEERKEQTRASPCVS